ncbi:hypothetical protein SLS62_002650 [Diatrype stigma]|uniref:Uncharacterized protein n=1 Tax=Diatrype stigma TaxID=117547 RepID=A0AAN9V8E8_9PEZI
MTFISLDKVKGSASEYRSLVKELNNLDRIILEVHRTCQTHLSNPQYTLGIAAKDTAEKLEADCLAFKENIKKYDAGLVNGSVNLLRRAKKKVQ